MKKRLLASLLAAAAAASCMVSCGNKSNTGNNQNMGSSAPSSAAGNEAAGKAVVLTLPTYYCGENVGAIYFEPAVKRFNEQYAGRYEVRLEEVVEASYNDKMSTLAQSGKLPVLISGGSNEWMKTVLIPRKLYWDTGAWLQESGIMDLCLDASVEYSTQEDGSIVGIPMVSVSTMGLYCNTTKYSPDKNVADMTVDEFVASLDGEKIAWQTVDNAWTSMLFMTALIANEEGGTGWLQEYDGGKCYDYDNAWMQAAAAKFVEIWNKTGGSAYIGKAYADAANDFMSNNSAVICNGTWMNAEFGADSTANWSNGFNGADVTADYYPGNIALCNTRGYGRWFITNNFSSDAELEAAKAFMEFIYSPEELEQFALTEGCQIPKLTYSENYLAKLEEQPLVKAQSEKLTDKTTIVPTIASIMPDSVANSVFGNELTRLVNGVISPEQFCSTLTVKAQEAKD